MAILQKVEKGQNYSSQPSSIKCESKENDTMLGISRTSEGQQMTIQSLRTQTVTITSNKLEVVYTSATCSKK